MKKLFKNRYLMLMLASASGFIFLFLSFFVWIIVKSDIIDIGRNRINLMLLGKDLAVFVIWLCFIPFIFFCVKKLINFPHN